MKTTITYAYRDTLSGKMLYESKTKKLRKAACLEDWARSMSNDFKVWKSEIVKVTLVVIYESK